MKKGFSLSPNKKTTKGKSWSKFEEIVRQSDTFGDEITLNVDGEGTIKTLAGAFCTLLYYVIMLVYLSKQVTYLTTRTNPAITTSFVENYYDNSKIFTFKDLGFKIAWTMESALN